MTALLGMVSADLSHAQVASRTCDGTRQSAEVFQTVALVPGATLSVDSITLTSPFSSGGITAPVDSTVVLSVTDGGRSNVFTRR